MSEDGEIRRNTELEMRLQSVKAAFFKLKFEAGGLVRDILGEHTNKDPIGRAKRLEAVMEALENVIR